MDSEKTYNTKQVAKMLDVSIATIVTYCQNGKISAIKVPMPSGRGFRYLIKGDDFLKLIKDLPITRGRRETGTRLGPFSITRAVNGELSIERVR